MSTYPLQDTIRSIPTNPLNCNNRKHKKHISPETYLLPCQLKETEEISKDLQRKMVFWKRVSEDVKPFPIDYKDIDPNPFFTIMNMLPESVRSYLATKMAKPELQKDGVDIFGEDYDPFTIIEMVPNRLWRVRHEHIPKNLGQLLKDFFGIDLLDPNLGDHAPEELKELLKNDQICFAKGEAMDGKEKIENGFGMYQDMFVVRLVGEGDDNDGGLLLYNPIRMHKRILEWFKPLGTVEWLVSGSSAHTNNMSFAATTFPSAKILCASEASQKCVAIGMRPADFLYDEPSSLGSAKDLLKAYNVGLYYMFGDVGTNALFVTVHDHVLEVDIMYGHHDGNRLSNSSPTEWVKPCTECDRHRCFSRLYYYKAIHGKTSPNGCLPAYRFMTMDPASPFCAIMINQPKKDGSNCTEMAKSLRDFMLVDDYHYAASVHSLSIDPIPADEFRRCVDASWRWLDGKSLLPE